MDCELTTKVINDDETSTRYKYKYYKNKIRENKVTISLFKKYTYLQ